MCSQQPAPPARRVTLLQRKTDPVGKTLGRTTGWTHRATLARRGVRMVNGVEYLNSGDWVESLTALVEDNEGNWKIIRYQDWVKTAPARKASAKERAVNNLLLKTINSEKKN